MDLINAMKMLSDTECDYGVEIKATYRDGWVETYDSRTNGELPKQTLCLYSRNNDSELRFATYSFIEDEVLFRDSNINSGRFVSPDDILQDDWVVIVVRL